MIQSYPLPLTLLKNVESTSRKNANQLRTLYRLEKCPLFLMKIRRNGEGDHLLVLKDVMPQKVTDLFDTAFLEIYTESFIAGCPVKLLRASKHGNLCRAQVDQSLILATSSQIRLKPQLLPPFLQLLGVQAHDHQSVLKLKSHKLWITNLAARRVDEALFENCERETLELIGYWGWEGRPLFCENVVALVFSFLLLKWIPWRHPWSHHPWSRIPRPPWHIPH